MPSANWALSPSSRNWSTFVEPTLGSLEAGSASTQGHSLAERLFDSRSGFKVAFATVAMHLSKDWRDRLFRQIDSLLDPDEWDERDAPVGRASSLTFIRLMLFLRPFRRPGLGVSHEGHLVAAWTSDSGRLTLVCRPDDQIRWLVSRRMEDGQIETAAGDTVVARLKEVIEPYQPASWLQA